MLIIKSQGIYFIYLGPNISTRHLTVSPKKSSYVRQNLLYNGHGLPTL